MKKKITLALLGLLVAFITLLATYFLSPIESKHNLKIPSTNPTKLINYLRSQGYFVNFLDELFVTIFPAHQGWVYISKTKLPRYEFLAILHNKGNYYTPFTIIPGETSYFVLKELAQKFDYNTSTLVQNYKKYRIFKEGNFIANTYNIPNYFDEQKTIKFLFNHSFAIHKKIAQSYGIDYKGAIYKRALVVASIIQKEAANKKEMPLIASVIYNRLRKKMRLQMDGSLNYGKYSHSKITPQRIKKDNSYYNTYKQKGLPKEPVCNVSEDAIKAAFNPADTNYLYFMKKDNTTHLFSSSFKEHRKNIKKRKEKLKQ